MSPTSARRSTRVQPDDLAGPDSVSATAPEVVLSGRSLVESYGSSQALRGVSVELGRGEILAVTGPSGSGKSTLLLCLAGVLGPDSGEVRFAGRRIDGEGESARAALRRREFGVLFQFGQLVAEMTAAENVALPLLLGGRAGVRPRRRRADGSRASVSRSWPTSCRARCLADYDCAGGSGDGLDYTGPARSVAGDPFDLDRDGDGLACEN